MPEEPVLWVGSRSLTAQDVERIRWTLRRFGALSPTALARTLGEAPLWTTPNGRLKVLPRPAAAAAGLRCHPPPPRARLGSQGPLRVPGHGAAQPRAPDPARRARPHPRRARGHAERPDCNAMLAAYHPLGFRRACGAQQRSGGREQASGRPHILGGSSLLPRPSPWPSATPGSARRPSSVGAASTASWPTAATSCCPTSPCRTWPVTCSPGPCAACRGTGAGDMASPWPTRASSASGRDLLPRCQLDPPRADYRARPPEPQPCLPRPRQGLLRLPAGSQLA